MYVDSTSERNPGTKKHNMIVQCSTSTFSHIRYVNSSCYFLRARFLLSAFSTLFVNRDMFFKTWQIMSLTLLRVKMYIYKDDSKRFLIFAFSLIIKFQGCLKVPFFNRGTFKYKSGSALKITQWITVIHDLLAVIWRYSRFSLTRLMHRTPEWWNNLQNLGLHFVTKLSIGRE